MVPLVTLAFFLLGTILASFVGVVAGRLYTGQSIISGRSRCDACDAPLLPHTLVPILSHVFLRGRAFCCGARLPLISPLSELLLGGLFVAAYHTLGLTSVLPFFLAALMLLLALVLYDLAHQILPYALLWPFVCVSAIIGFLSAPSRSAFLSSLLVAVLLGGSLALIHLFSRGRAMGLADAPLASGLALLVGPAAFSGFVFSFWIGAVIGIVLLLRRPPGHRMKVEVPFAPFLAAGFLLAYFTQWNLIALIAAASL